MTISITKPTVGGSENTWGATVNTALDDVVDVLNGNTASTPDLDGWFMEGWRHGYYGHSGRAKPYRRCKQQHPDTVER